MRQELSKPERRGQEGMALVLAILVLLVLTVAGAALMLSVNTESKISGHQTRDTQALAAAEAGVSEAVVRIRNGDIADDMNPRAVSLIYNNVAGSIPVSGVDTTSLPTLQPAGSYLAYTTPNKTAGVLSVKYKTKGSQILLYNDLANPKINTATGNPIWVITSTGRQGPATRTIVAEVTRARFNISARSAVTANVAIQFQGNIKICGHDHRIDTPAYTGPPQCNTGIGAWWAPTIHGTCLPGAWSTQMVTEQGAPTVIGEPSTKAENQIGFYEGPWDAIGLTQNDFWSWVGTPVATEPSPFNGLYYLDNDAVRQNKSGSWAFNGGTGEGLLYCDGDLQLNGNLAYRGLIYAEGDVRVNGNLWLLGGLVVNGKTLVKIANGSAIILYSSESIALTISKYGGQLRNIAWREL